MQNEFLSCIELDFPRPSNPVFNRLQALLIELLIPFSPGLSRHYEVGNKLLLIQMLGRVKPKYL